MIVGQTHAGKTHKMRASRLWLTAALLAILAAVVFNNALDARAQEMSIANIQILGIDSREFPLVRVKASVRFGNNELVPVSDLDNLDLLEQDVPVKFEVTPARTPIETLFVLDAGAGITSDGATGRARFDEMKRFLLAYVEAVHDPGDTSGVMIVTPEGQSYLQPMTSDDQVLQQKITQLSIPQTSSLSDGLRGLWEALDELEASPARGLQEQYIVLLSMGIQSSLSNLGGVIDRARSSDVPIHTVLFRGEISDQDGPLKDIARDTGGIYLYYQDEDSAQPLLGHLADMHTLYEFQFKSGLGTREERKIELRVRDSGERIVRDLSSYLIDLQPPAIRIETPVDSALIQRDSSLTHPDGSALPETVQITARVDWPDGHPRIVTQAQLWVDGVLLQPPLSSPGEQIVIDWDVSALQPGELHKAQLQVLVRDELGLEAISSPVSVSVLINVLTAGEQSSSGSCSGLSGLAAVRCLLDSSFLSGLTGFSLWISLGSLLVALATILVSVRYRHQLAKAGGSAVEAMRQTITRLISPVDNQVGAYLEVIQGDDALRGKYIPLYVNSTTPVGRSPGEAEIVLNLNNDKSIISRLHCEFLEENGVFRVRDLGSTQGTYVNGERVPESREGQVLLDGDRVELGPTERGGVQLTFRTADSPDLRR